MSASEALQTQYARDEVFRFLPKGDIRSAAELQASNLQLLALTAYSITSSLRTSIEGGTARPRVLAVLARGARPNDLPVQLPAKL